MSIYERFLCLFAWSYIYWSWWQLSPMVASHHIYQNYFSGARTVSYTTRYTNYSNFNIIYVLAWMHRCLRYCRLGWSDIYFRFAKLKLHPPNALERSNEQFGAFSISLDVLIYSNCRPNVTGLGHFDGLMQDCSALAMEVLHSCTKPSIYGPNSVIIMDRDVSATDGTTPYAGTVLITSLDIFFGHNVSLPVNDFVG